jgi:uncharacterized membrane protein
MTSRTAGRSALRRRARGLGLVSLGLGVAQLAAPAAVRRLTGVDDSTASRRMVPLAGARELVHATGLLTARRVGPWAWTRVAGDAMDLAALAVAFTRGTRPRRRRLAAVTGAVLAITALDVVTAVQASRDGPTRTRRAGPRAGPMELTATTTIRKPVADVYAFWRRFDTFGGFMAHVDEVRVTGDRTSHWTVTGPLGQPVEWDAEITEEVPVTTIAWRSVGDADVPNAGRVMFAAAPDGVGTEVHVLMTYDIPGGPLGRAVARCLGEKPQQQLDDDLRRLKQVLETGSVVRSDGAPCGKHTRGEFPQRPARPLPPELVPEVLAVLAP